MLNVHFSLLPRWHAACPCRDEQFFAGDLETGVCIMGLDVTARLPAALYSRAVASCRSAKTRRASELVMRLEEIGNDLLVSCIANGIDNLPGPEEQVGEVTYASKITPEDLKIDFGQGSAHNYARIRVGRAWTTFRGERFLIHEARDLLGATRATSIRSARSSVNAPLAILSDEPALSRSGDRGPTSRQKCVRASCRVGSRRAHVFRAQLIPTSDAVPNRRDLSPEALPGSPLVEWPAVASASCSRKPAEIKVSPSILSADFGGLAEAIGDEVSVATDWLHVDVMDGHFVPNLTIGPPVVASLRKHSAAHSSIVI